MTLFAGDTVGVLPAAERAWPRLLLPIRRPRALWLLLAAAVALRLIAMCAVPLIPEEAYYWVYSQQWQLSYYDHPPMVAWVIHLGTLLFGNTELGVRIAAAVLMAGATVLLYRLARAWFDRPATVLAAVLLQVLPVYFGIALVAPMDAALCFFWVACLLGVTHSLKTNHPGGWYLAGAALGGALLSKYSAIFLAAGVFLAVLGNRRWRHHLRTIHPFLAFAVAAVLFTPVIWWNATHGWASFRFQFIERFAEDRFNLITLPAFAATQLLILTPVPLIALAALLLHLGRRRRSLLTGGISDRRWFAVACALPGLAAAAWTSLRSEVQINWTAPILLPLLPAICAYALAHDRLRSRTHATARRWQPALALTAAICAAVAVVLMLFLLILQPRLRLWDTFGPWHELASVVEEQEDRIEEQTGREPRIVGDGKYRLASVLAFYRMPIETDQETVVPNTTSQWIFGDKGLGYEYWSRRADWVGADVIYVAEAGKRDVLRAIKPWFESVEQIRDQRLGANATGYDVIVGHRLRAEPEPTATKKKRAKKRKAS